jgi:hypothetical protein
MKRLALSFIVGGSLIAGFAPGASASGLNSGCPPSYQLWVVGSNPLYHADAFVNKNGDPYVCAKQIDDKTIDGTNPLYNFVDNTGVIA